jgi:hypothetical protein
LHYLEAEHAKGEVVTGLNFIDEDLPGMHAISKTELAPLARHCCIRFTLSLCSDPRTLTPEL